MKTLTLTLILSARLAMPAVAKADQSISQVEQVEGAWGPLNRRAMMPTERKAPEVQADVFDLPPTRRPDGESGHGTAQGFFQSAGYVEPPPPGLLVVPDWQQAVAGGEACAIELVSANAVALRVRLSGRLVEGAQLRVYDPIGGAAFGPYTWLRPNEQGVWWSTIIFGDRIGLEFLWTREDQPVPALPQITAIAYIYDPPPVTRGDCAHHDATCEPDWADPADAVTMLSVISAGNVVGYCSGAVLNRQPGDFSPLVMTANHCVGGNGGQPTADNTSFVFLFETYDDSATSQCPDGPPPNLNSLPRSDGSLLVKRHSSSDWNLLGLYEPPETSFYLGWNSDYWDIASDATGIHHPGGTYRRINFGQKSGDTTEEFCDGSGQNCFLADVWNVYWWLGFTEPGSSGSPVLDSLAQVRGTLSGGSSENCYLDRYGRFDLAFFFLRYYLANMNIASPTHVDGSVAGDPGNNGGVEQGTSAQPFNTVHEATFAVRAGDTVQIAVGNYNERFKLWRPMTLARWGSSGIVRIGAP